MAGAFILSHNIISPLGNSSRENFSRVLKGESGVQLHNRQDIDQEPFWASLIGPAQFRTITAPVSNSGKYSSFENLLIASVQDALKNSPVDVLKEKTAFIFSTTKGNISLLDAGDGADASADHLALYPSARKVVSYFNSTEEPILISNACVSGAFALLLAKRLLESGQYENAIVAGADTISNFVYSGFKSFQALSPGRCRPFSADRDGINLGEAAAAVILSSRHKSDIRITGGASSNDANHISGPSRTGAELSMAINGAMKMAGIHSSDIGFISAHGTATPFNDEMEAKAFNLSDLQHIPVNGLKVYFGHTLGAAGLVESVISLMSLQDGVVVPIIGFSGKGTEPGVRICSEVMRKPADHFLKTASGFGGCNTSLVFSKS